MRKSIQLKLEVIAVIASFAILVLSGLGCLYTNMTAYGSHPIAHQPVIVADR